MSKCILILVMCVIVRALFTFSVMACWKEGMLYDDNKVISTCLRRDIERHLWSICAFFFNCSCKDKPDYQIRKADHFPAVYRVLVL